MHNHESHIYGGDHTENHFGFFSTKKLAIVLAINGIFFAVEIVGALISGSLALMADAGHMFTDMLALVLALFVAGLAQKRPTPKRTFGLLRAEVLGAFANGALLMVVVVYIYIEAFKRLGGAPEINDPVMLAVGILGLVGNLVGAWILFGSRNDNLNLKGAFLHLIADSLGSVGVILGALIIGVTGWYFVDPIISIIIGLIIFISSLKLISQTVKILLESTPENLDFGEIHSAIIGIDHVSSVHDLHIWTIATGLPSLSAHVKLKPECTETKHWQECLRKIQDTLAERYGIVHSTIQIEPEDYKTDNRPV